MSMSTHVIVFRNMDDKFEKMLEIKKFCDRMDVSYPEEVEDFFGDFIGYGDSAIKENMATVEIKNREWSCVDLCAQGIEIDVKDIPSDAKTIRFYNSW